MDIKQCNKCGKQKRACSILKWKILTINLQRANGDVDFYDLCPDCYKKFQEFITVCGTRKKIINNNNSKAEMADNAVKEALGVD